MNISSKRNKENDMDIVNFEGKMDFTVCLRSTPLRSVKWFQVLLSNTNNSI